MIIVKMRSTNLKNFYFRSTLFAIFSIGAAGFSYLIYPVLTRILSPTEFGEFASVIAITSQVLGIIMSLNILTIYIVKNYTSKNAVILVNGLQVILLRIFLLIGATMLVFSPFLIKILDLRSSFSILAILAVLLCAIPVSMLTGYMQGNRKTAHAGFAGFITSLIKLVVIVILSYLYGLSGSLLGVVFAALISVIIYSFISGSRFLNITQILKPLEANTHTMISNIKKYVLFTVLSVALLAVLQNIDILITKALFNEVDAGRYASIGLFSNIVFYLGLFVIMIILPEIEITNPRHNLRLVRKATASIVGMLVFGLASIMLFGGDILNAVLGSDYVALQKVLLYALLYQSSLVFISLVLYFLVIVNKHVVSGIAAITTFLAVAIQPFLEPKTILVLISRLALTSLVMALIIGTIGFRLLNNEITDEEN